MHRNRTSSIRGQVPTLDLKALDAEVASPPIDSSEKDHLSEWELLGKIKKIWQETADKAKTIFTNKDFIAWLALQESYVKELSVNRFFSFLESLRLDIERQSIDFFIPLMNEFLQRVSSVIKEKNIVNVDSESLIRGISSVVNQIAVRERQIIASKISKLWKKSYDNLKSSFKDNQEISRKLTKLFKESLKNRSDFQKWADWLSELVTFAINNNSMELLTEVSRFLLEIKSLVDESKFLSQDQLQKIYGSKDEGLLSDILDVEFAIMQKIYDDLEHTITNLIKMHTGKHIDTKARSLSGLRSLDWYKNSFEDEQGFKDFYENLFKSYYAPEFILITSEIFKLIDMMYESMESLPFVSLATKALFRSCYSELAEVRARVKVSSENSSRSSSKEVSPRVEETRTSEEEDDDVTHMDKNKFT